MQLFEEKTTKRHARLVGLGAVLAATQVFQIEMTKIPIIGVEGVDPNAASILLSVLVIVWFVTWAQLYYFDEVLKVTELKFVNLSTFSKLYYEQSEEFQIFSAQDSGVEAEYSTNLRLGSIGYIDVADEFMDPSDIIMREIGKCNREFKLKKTIFHLTKLAHYCTSFLALTIAILALFGWPDFLTYTTESPPPPK